MSDTRRLISCLLVCLASFTQGVMYAWNSFAVPQLTSDNNLNNTDLIISYVSSSHSMGSAVGAIFSGFISYCGPLHRVIPIISLLTAVAWSVIALVKSLPILATGKFFVGFLIVLECSHVPLYIASVCPEKYSGFLLSLFSITRNLSQILYLQLPLLWCLHCFWQCLLWSWLMKVIIRAPNPLKEEQVI